jgi:polyisoprenoid-binding protein YceI
MKTLAKLILTAALAAVPLLASAHTADPGQYKIDPVHSYAHFTVTHLGVSRFTGRFDKLAGEVSADGSGPANKVVAEIDVTSVDTGFADRDKHLKSPDFFAAAQYPKARFESTKVSFDAKGQGTLAGNLTLHGVTKPVTFQLQHIGAGKDPWGGYRAGYVATTTLKRSDFGMNFMLDGISDAVDLTLNIETIKQ